MAEQVLVTGGTGFLGAALIQALLRLGAEVVATCREPLGATATGAPRWVRWRCEAEGSAAELLACAGATNVTAIVHTAGQANAELARRNPKDAVWANILGAANVLEATRLSDGGIRRTLILSTSAYQADGKRSGEPYFVSKYCAEALAYCYRSTYCTPVAVIRLGTVYGVGDTDRGRLVPSLAQCVVQGSLPAIRDPRALVDLTYITDVVAGICSILDAPELERAYDISSGALFEVEQVATYMLGLATGKRPGPPEPRRKIFSAVAPPGWAAVTSLEYGFRRVLEHAGSSYGAVDEA